MTKRKRDGRYLPRNPDHRWAVVWAAHSTYRSRWEYFGELEDARAFAALRFDEGLGPAIIDLGRVAVNREDDDDDDDE